MIMRLYVLFIHHIQSLDFHNFTKKSLEKVVQICKKSFEKVYLCSGKSFEKV